MDIDLLSKMVYDLILENDRVGLPGVGCFIAELVPATFTDRGYTINPPYRKLSFRSRPDDGDLLVDLYAKSNNIGTDAARGIVTDFLAEMKDVLLAKKVIVFPGLGRLRATKENNFFFVADENLDIYPEGLGLQPLSLKTRRETGRDLADAIDAVVKIVGEPAAGAAVEPVAEQTSNQAVEPTSEPVSEPATEPVTEPNEESVAETVAESAANQAGEPIPEPVSESGTEPVAEPVAEPAVEPAVEPTAEPVIEPVTEPAAEPTAKPAASAAAKPAPKPAPATAKKPEWRKTALTVVVSVLLFAAIAFVAFALLARLCPDFVDKLLYTKEELEILNAVL